MNETKSKKIEFICEDNVLLIRTVFYPEPFNDNQKIVIINPATATKTRYYYPFSEFLNQHGYIVVTWNYRGIDESRLSDLSKVKYTLLDEGTKDMPAVINKTRELFPENIIYIIGHSVGAQQIGFVHNHDEISGLIAVGSSVGYTGYMPKSYMIQTHYFFRIFTPISIALKGYVQCSLFNIMEDLPKQVVLDWRDWCSVKDYFFDKKFYGKSVPIGNFKKLKFPIEVFTATDDSIANKRSVPQLWKHFQTTKSIKFHWYNPKETNLKEIGHFGYFRRSQRDFIWKDILTKLESF